MPPSEHRAYLLVGGPQAGRDVALHTPYYHVRVLKTVPLSPEALDAVASTGPIEETTYHAHAFHFNDGSGVVSLMAPKDWTARKAFEHLMETYREFHHEKNLRRRPEDPYEAYRWHTGRKL